MAVTKFNSSIALRPDRLILRGAAPTMMAGALVIVAAPAGAQSLSREPIDAKQPVVAAPAQDENTSRGADTELADVVVTAQRRAENLQKVPIAITVVSNARLEAAGVTSPLALSNAASGVTIKSQVNSFAPFVRGVGTSSFGPGIENPVALYVDNVYYASQQTAPSDLNEVAQLAILKGPQGTLFGRNATGGVIQMTTLDPQFTTSGQLRTEIDQYLTSRNFAYVTGPISDQLAVGVSGHYTKQGEGWGDNLATRQEIFKIFHDYGVRGKFLFRLSGGTTVRINGDYNNQRNNLGANLREDTRIPDAVTIFGLVPQGGSRYDLNNARDNLNRAWNGGVSGTLEQDVGFGRLVSITAYRRFRFRTAFSPSQGPAPGFDIDYDQRGRQFSQELQLLSDKTGPFRWVLGAYYFLGREGLADFNNNFHNAFAAFAGLDRLKLFGSERTESIAGFAQATLRLGGSTNLTGGFRYTHDNRRISNSYTQGFVNVPFAGLIPVFTTPAIRDTQKIGRPTWRLSVDHELKPDVLLYASYNRGFKSGGFNVFSPGQAAYLPERLDAFEGGTKLQLFDRRLRLNPSAFYYDYQNIQLTRIQQTVQVVNAQKARFYGADIEGEAIISDAFSLNAGVEFLHAEIKRFPNATTSVIGAFGPGSPGVTLVTPFDASGNRIPFAAKFTLNVGATYKRRVAAADMALTVTNAHNSGYFFEPDNLLRQKAFDILNAELKWVAPGERLQVGLFARNILDRAVATQASTSVPQGYQVDFGTPPFTFGANLRVKFGGG